MNVTFKPGDRVRVKTYGWESDGVVEWIEKPSNIVYVDTDEYGRIGFAANELELIVEKPFVPGDHVEWVTRGTVKGVSSDGTVYVNANDGQGQLFFVDEEVNKLTKIAPPFPTRDFSVIVARKKNDGNEIMLSKHDGFWIDAKNSADYTDHDLELISVEYVPND